MNVMYHRASSLKVLLALTTAYFVTSLGHFSHNAEFICEYPNLPAWLTSAQVYAVWAAITFVGATGLLLMRKKFMATGLLLIAVYAALGFDGLGHYALAEQLRKIISQEQEHQHDLATALGIDVPKVFSQGA